MRVTRRHTTAITICVNMRIYQSRHREAYFVIVFGSALLVALSVTGKPDYTISSDLHDLILRHTMTIE